LWWGSRKHLLDLEIDGRVIKLRISKEWDWRAFRAVTSGRGCEHGNELLESVNCAEVLTTWAVLSFFRRRLLDEV
jgi:hypothetical protein